MDVRIQRQLLLFVAIFLFFHSMDAQTLPFYKIYRQDSASSRGMYLYYDESRNGYDIVAGRVYQYAPNQIYWNKNLVFLQTDNNGNILHQQIREIPNTHDGSSQISQNKFQRKPNGDLIIPLIIDPYKTWALGRNFAYSFFTVSSAGDSVRQIYVLDSFNGSGCSLANFVSLPNDDIIFGTTRGLGGPRVLSQLRRVDSQGVQVWKKDIPILTGNHAPYLVEVTRSTNGNDFIALLNNNYFISHPPTCGLCDTTYEGVTNPRIIVFDENGKSLKDTSYPTILKGIARGIVTDRFGGYFIYGFLDTALPAPWLFPKALYSPAYVAHFDDNFRRDWTYLLPTQNILAARQLNNGDIWLSKSNSTYDTAGMFRLSRSGQLKWYQQLEYGPWNGDSLRVIAQYDVIELADGKLVMTGPAGNHWGPVWKTVYDYIDLLMTDSNGCFLSGCRPSTAVLSTPFAARELRVFPNPVKSRFTISAPATGTLLLYNMQGSIVGRYSIQEREQTLCFPEGTSPGVYFGRFVGSGDHEAVVLKLLYEP